MFSTELLVPVLLSLISLGLLYSISKLKKQFQKQTLESQERIGALEHELSALSNAAMGVGRKAVEHDSVIVALESKIEQIKHNDPSHVSYSEAARLVGMGATVEDLMAATGISKPEAELIRTLTLNGQVEHQAEDIPVLKQTY